MRFSIYLSRPPKGFDQIYAKCSRCNGSGSTSSRDIMGAVPGYDRAPNRCAGCFGRGYNYRTPQFWYDWRRQIRDNWRKRYARESA
jgi:hypothetical protein